MILVAYFNLKLHQIDVKTTFLDEQLFEEIFYQPEGFQA